MIAHPTHISSVLVLLLSLATCVQVPSVAALATPRIDHDTNSHSIVSPSPVISCTLNADGRGNDPAHNQILDQRVGGEEARRCIWDVTRCRMGDGTCAFPNGDIATYHELQLEPGRLSDMEHGEDEVHAAEELENHDGSEEYKNQPIDSPTGNTDGEGNQLQDMSPDLRSGKPSVTTVLLLTSSGLVLVAMMLILLRSPPKRLCGKRFAASRFRINEAQLLRRADEDVGLVNSEENNGWDDLINDESIPLKPTPRKNISVHYGSAQGHWI
ncbi:hypothetical protein PAXRUDRAFT_829361 [Paxillus rubicundulus Ve08.2h10]|uniref:Uncharacterized protein n=1 Tax=Paxillus rubicundulus Ve08.2h10 TaxID=930991 RepID=A0A0D0E082_9AGAM|nr:hypothetical protein PAXRUDRAFT_829361 [Paxillus rubicundulus Ve08.2h10]